METQHTMNEVNQEQKVPTGNKIASLVMSLLLTIAFSVSVFLSAVGCVFEEMDRVSGSVSCTILPLGSSFLAIWGLVVVIIAIMLFFQPSAAKARQVELYIHWSWVVYLLILAAVAL